MAVEIADLTARYSRMSTVDINQMALWPMLFNRNWQSELMGANKVVIQDPSYNTAPKNRTREDNFDTPVEGSAAQLELTINIRREQANTFDYEDVEEAPLDWLNRTRASQAATLSAGNSMSIDTAVFNAFAALTYAGKQKATLGKAGTDFVARTGAYAGSGVGYGLVLDAIQRLSLYFKRENVLSPGRLIGGTVGSPWMVIQPELLIGLARWLTEKGYSWDQLTRAALVDVSLISGAQFGGRMFGVDVYSSNTLAVPASGKNWTFYGGTDQSMTVAEKPTFVQIIDPLTNQSGPKWTLRQIARWATLEVNKDLKYQFQVNAV